MYPENILIKRRVLLTSVYFVTDCRQTTTKTAFRTNCFLDHPRKNALCSVYGSDQRQSSQLHQTGNRRRHRSVKRDPSHVCVLIALDTNINGRRSNVLKE